MSEKAIEAATAAILNAVTADGRRVYWTPLYITPYAAAKAFAVAALAALPPLRAGREVDRNTLLNTICTTRGEWGACQSHGDFSHCWRCVALADATLSLFTAQEAPGHTDLMVSPESIDAFMEANPLPAVQGESERLRIHEMRVTMSSIFQLARDAKPDVKTLRAIRDAAERALTRDTSKVTSPVAEPKALVADQRPEPIR